MSAMTAPEGHSTSGRWGGQTQKGPGHNLCGWTVFCNCGQLGGFLGSDASGPSFPSGSRQETGTGEFMTESQFSLCHPSCEDTTAELTLNL